MTKTEIVEGWTFASRTQKITGRTQHEKKQFRKKTKSLMETADLVTKIMKVQKNEIRGGQWGGETTG